MFTPAKTGTGIEKLVVIELSNILAGPSIGMFLAELGARVIKIENPLTKGDTTRQWKLAGESKESDISAYFSCANWGKESIAIDLYQPHGQQIVYDLIKKADIVLQSYKPGAEKKLGLDYETLKKLNPKLIYAHITAYGQQDKRPGFDAIIQAESGFTYINGEPDSPPTKMPVALVDVLAAHQLKEAVLLALLRRANTGEGSYLTTSLIKSAAASLVNQATNWLVAGVVPERMGSSHPNIVPYGTVFETKDKRPVVLAPATNKQYQSCIKSLGLVDLIDDPRFLTNQNRVKHRDSLNQYIAEKISKIDSKQLAEQFSREQIPFGFVNSMREVFDINENRQLLMAGALVDGKPITGLRGVAFSGDVIKEKQNIKPPPNFNQHGDELLKELGYSKEKILKLYKQNVVPKVT